MKPLKALSEVLRIFFQKPATRKYPFEKAVLFDRTRAMIKFDPSKCVGCQACVKDCPVSTIKITLIQPPKFNFAFTSAIDGKKATHSIPKAGKRQFTCDIDNGKCIFCAQCVDSCKFKALSSSHEFELAGFDRKGLEIHYAPNKDAK